MNGPFHFIPFLEREQTVDGFQLVAGKEVSKKKEELDNILDHFNIQVENPVSIMNQEMSRSFLQTQSDKVKYEVRTQHGGRSRRVQGRPPRVLTRVNFDARQKCLQRCSRAMRQN